MKLSQLTKDEIPAFCKVDAAAMADWPLSQARVKTHPSGLPREQIIQSWVSSSLSDPEDETTWMKVVDTQTGNIVAGAAWCFQLQDRIINEESLGGEKDVKEEEKENVSEAVARIWSDFERKTIRGRRHASELSLLSCLPFLEK